MSEEAKKLKNVRKVKLTAFTRKQNHLQNLVDTGSCAEELEEAFSDLKAVYRSLEKAHEDYAGVVDEEVLDNEGDYLGASSGSLNMIGSSVKSKIKQLKATEKENRANRDSN